MRNTKATSRKDAGGETGKRGRKRKSQREDKEGTGRETVTKKQTQSKPLLFAPSFEIGHG